ncbi:MAG: ABC transporter permease [Gemmatimonadetes bacterium]|nr:ABC transporter permease [Gemmatimonadota bacterium]
MTPRPPLFVRWLLRLVLSRDDRRTVTNDLHELFERRRARDGDRAAAAWGRRQWRRHAYYLTAERVRNALRLGQRNPAAGSQHSGEIMRNFLRDLRHSVRSLARTPVLTMTIVLTVGLGIGATTAIFSVINSVLLRPLPYPDPGRLVRIYTDSPPNRWPFSVADYRALDEQQTSFSQVAGYRNRTMTFNRDDVAERITGKLVTPTYFPLLGILPAHGRLFTDSDGLPEAEPAVVVSHGFWTQYLGSDDAVVGQTLSFNGQEYTLVGVLPRAVGPFEQNREFYIAVQWDPPPRKGPFFITALARLKPDATMEAATEELRAINRRLFPVWQVSYQDERASWGVMDLKELVVGDVGTTLAVVLGAVVFVLLIACTNAANLLVARATHRSRELAVRAALGASRGRLLQHLLSESTLLALAGAAVGVVLTVGGMKLLTTVGADFIPRTQEIGFDGPVLWFLATLTIASGLLFGLIPSLHGAKTRFEQAFRASGITTAMGTGPRRLRRALVVSQFAVAVPLLIGAGLLIGSLAKLQSVDPGFDSRNILTVGALLPASAYPDTVTILRFWEAAFARVDALPGVQSVALADGRPPREYQMSNNFDLEDKPTPPGASQPSVPWIGASPEYFTLMGIPLLQGRLFDARDSWGATPVAIVDQAWARRFFPNEEVLGRRFYSGGCTTCPMFTVVGVVGDVKYTGLDDPGESTVYWPMTRRGSRFAYLYVRTSTDPLAILPPVRQIVRDIDPAIALQGISTIDELMIDSLDTPRYLTILVSAFAAVALVLSVIGIYGVMAYFVQQHARDIGIRMALGGRPATVVRMVVGQGMRLVGVGMLAGLGGAFFLTRYMSSVLFDVGATDPRTYSIVAFVMLGVALGACFVPARRAAGVDPARTLRED